MATLETLKDRLADATRHGNVQQIKILKKKIQDKERGQL